MQSVLLVIQLLLSVAMIAAILIQRTAQDGGGLMGGSGGTMGGLFTARGSANLLTRTTAILATLFICNSLLLGYLASSGHGTRSALDQVAPLAAPSTPEVPNGAAPAPEQKAPEAPKMPQVPLAK